MKKYLVASADGGGGFNVVAEADSMGAAKKEPLPDGSYYILKVMAGRFIETPAPTPRNTFESFSTRKPAAEKKSKKGGDADK